MEFYNLEAFVRSVRHHIVLHHIPVFWKADICTRMNSDLHTSMHYSVIPR